MTWVVQFFWLALIYVEPFFSSPIGKIIKSDNASRSSSPTPFLSSITNFPSIPPWMLAIFAIVLVAMTLYLIFASYLPTVNKTSERVVEKAAEKVINRVESSQKKHVSRKQHVQLTHRVVFWTKIIISCFPIVIVLFFTLHTKLVPHIVALGVAAFISFISVILFILHRLLASLLDDINENKHRKKTGNSSKSVKSTL